MRILILGAQGKLGRMLSQIWADHDQITCICASSRPAPGMVLWKPGQIWPGPRDYDAIVALWGVTSGADLEENSDLAIAALELARDLEVPCVVHCSSIAVYGPGRDIGEERIPHPVNPYGRAKLRMEQVIARWHQNHPEITSVIARIGNVIGADSLAAQIATGGLVQLDQFPDGLGPQRSYITAKDLAGCFHALLQNRATGIWNIAAPGALHMAELLDHAGTCWSWQPAPERAVQHVTMNTSRIQSIYSFQNSILGEDI
jgi:nucleoside-diphosphate-sugar epimerase